MKPNETFEDIFLKYSDTGWSGDATCMDLVGFMKALEEIREDMIRVALEHAKNQYHHQ